MSGQRRILVIDQSEAIRLTTLALLEEGGYAVSSLSSPALLPSILRKERFDLVLVGDAPPPIGTRAMLEMARGVQGESCPLVVFTDRSEGELRRVLADCKVGGIVHKTHDGPALCREVAACIAGTAVESNEVALLVGQPTVRLILEEYLRKLGCEPFALDPESCVEELIRRRPLAAMLDLDAAPICGDACCQRIKDHPLARETPVVLLAASATEEQVMRCWHAGADDCLPLPMSVPVLSGKVAALRAARTSARAERSVQRHPVLVCLPRHDEQLLTLLSDNGFRPLVARSRPAALDLLKRTGTRVVAALVELGLAGPDAAGLAQELAGEQGVPVLFAADGPIAVEALPRGVEEGAVFDLQRPLETVINRLNRVVAGSVRNPGMPRVPFYSRVDFRVAGERTWQTGFAYDLSLVGVFVRTLTPLGRGSELELEIDFGGKKQPTRGLVAWKNPFGERRTYAYPPGMGVHLFGLPRELTLHVRQLLRPSSPGGT